MRKFSFRSSKPQRNGEPISDSRIPGIQVLRAAKVAPVTRYQPQIVFEVVIKADIESFVLNVWQAVSSSVLRKYLLHAAHQLHLLERGIRRRVIEFVRRFQPVPMPEIAV